MTPKDTGGFSAVGISPEGSSRRIGERLRSLRSARRLTILELSAKAGVSAGLISQIERGNSNPSVKTLQKIRAALGTNLWEFLDQGRSSSEENEPFVQRKQSRPRLVFDETRMVKELLSPQNDQNLRFMIVTLPAGGRSQDVLVGKGYKGGLILSGSVELTVGDRVSELLEGDSFQFKAHIPHRIANRSDSETKLIWIMSVLDTHL